jgi:hypothetical protein
LFEFNIENEQKFVYNFLEARNMNIVIEIIYLGWKHEVLRTGSFPVNKKKFAKNPDQTAAELALSWIWIIRKNENVSKIIKVTYNKDHDITKLVNALDHPH